MACDGDIAPEEVQLVKNLCDANEALRGMKPDALLDNWIREINEEGASFLHSYIKEVGAANLNKQEQLKLVSLAIKTIEADNVIQYSEVKFFKKIRARLTVSDEDILAEHPDKEAFLLPDLNVDDIPEWDADTRFAQIVLN